MSDQESTQETQDMPAVEEQVSGGQSPWDAHAASDSGDDTLPLMGAAFVGGVMLARILKRLGGDD